MGDMRRVCCFCERWESGGIESFLRNVLTRMDMTDMEVDIVASSIGESVFTDALRQNGVRFFELSGSQRNIPENHRRFRELLRERRYDVLHVNAYHGLTLAYLHIAKQEGVPLRIAHAHGAGLRKSLLRPLKLLIHRLARERYTRDATALWACSQSAAKFLFPQKALRLEPIKIIPNGIKAERFRFDPFVRQTVRGELGLGDELLIGHVGRLCYEKNQSFLLDVFARFHEREPRSRLLLVGSGPEESRLREKARELRIAETVIFYGTTSHVERLLWAMDIFVFPSLFEGLGIAAIEAQAAGLPVICSERIPAEARLTGHARTVPLARGIDAWTEALLTARGRSPDGPEAVRAAGYGISDTAREIEACFLRSDAHGKPQNLSHHSGI